MSGSTILDNIINFVNLYSLVETKIDNYRNWLNQEKFGFPNFLEEVRDRVWDKFEEDNIKEDIEELVIKSAPKYWGGDVEQITDEVIDEVWYKVAEEMSQGGLFLAGFLLMLPSSRNLFKSLGVGEDIWTIYKRGLSQVSNKSMDVSFPIVWKIKIQGEFLEQAKEQAVAQAFHEEQVLAQAFYEEE